MLQRIRLSPRLVVLAASVVGIAALALTPRIASAVVTITDCSNDSHCVAKGKRTVIEVLDDTVVIAGAIAPLPDTETIRVEAQAITINAGASLSATGKGRSIDLIATGAIVVHGDLLSSNSNGKIMLESQQLLRIEGPLDIESGGDIDLECQGANCPLVLVRSHLKANHIFIDVTGSVIYEANDVDLFGPRDFFRLNAPNGSLRKSGPIAAALAAGRGAATPGPKVDPLSEALAFCQCPGTLPTPTPTRTPTPTFVGGTASAVPPTPTPTATSSAGTPTAGTPTAGTPTGSTPTAGTPTATGSTPTVTPTIGGPTASLVPPTSTPTATPTPPVTTASPTPGTPTVSATPTGPSPTPTPGECGQIIGGVESTLFITVNGDLDLSCITIRVAEDIRLTATGNIDLSNAEINNDHGKCGEIVITAGGQVNIQGATLIDDNCRNNPDVSEINGREQVPHTGFNNTVGTPVVDD